MSAGYQCRDIPLGPPRRRALLALLLIRLGRVVPTTVLIEELWRDARPQHAVATLQSHISHLRKALAPAAGPDRSALLRYQAPGYILRLAPDQVDAYRFEQLFSTGRRLLADQNPLAARDRLTRALKLWHGAPYAEFLTHPSLADESARLEQMRLTALESSAEAGLLLGRTAEVVTELEREVRQHPARERMVGHLMTALFRSGRQAEALEMYAWTRSYLAEEFGVDTSADLQRLHTALLRQELGGQRAHGTTGGPVRRGATAFPRQVRTTMSSAAAGTAAPRPPAELAVRAQEAPDGADKSLPRSATPSPSPGEPGMASPLIGREREVGLLVAAMAGTAAGRGHLACVLGFSGLGKTHLVMELVQRLRALNENIETIQSSSFSGEGVPPYWLWTQVVRRLSVERPEAFRAAAAPFGSLLAPLLPGWLPDQDGGTVQGDPQNPFRTHDALCEVLLALAAQQPLVLVLEDLHRADAASLDLLRLLANRRQGHPLGIVLTGWDLETWPDSSRYGAMTEMLRGPNTQILRLGALTLPDVTALVEAHAGPGIDRRIVEVIHQQSVGSPSFVLQMLSLLGEEGDLQSPRTANELLGLVVPCARKVLRRELAELPVPVLRLLRLCAIAAPDIELNSLCRAAGGDAAAAVIVESAVRHGLLASGRQHGGRLRLTPPRAREILVGELTGEENQQLHAAYADALPPCTGEEIPPERSDRIAHHAWCAKGAMPPERALPWFLAAAENAGARLASDDRLMWLRRAVALTGSLPDGSDARGLASQLHWELAHLLCHVRGFGDTEAETEILRGQVPGTFLHRSDDPEVLSMLSASLLVRGRYDESGQLTARLKAIASRTGDPAARLGAVYGEGMALFIRDRLPDALRSFEHGVELSERLAREGQVPDGMYRSDPRVYFRTHDVFARWLMGERSAAAEQCRRLLRLTQWGDKPWDRVHALYVNAMVAAWEDDPDSARAFGTEGVGLSVKHGLSPWAAMLHVPLGWALTHAGQREGIPKMVNALTEMRLSRTRIHLPLHLGLLAQAQHHAGQREGAVDTLRTLLAVVEHHREYVYLNSALPATLLLDKLLGKGTRKASGAVDQSVSFGSSDRPAP
ncbi:BTAD domain-containing putative transcriptional regulator [Streptomyces sp. ITFR-6]|uniref:BTAD domain-containing putative transcriptional regulator n=1 Tax=Streptomyces sp. ITFR-6 TaxID=3075197 RepID=UPI00288BB970|nr:BTAD domain-containing putative transcriptional regulator [Streptomyces sp. ITFR-6]WNI28144.1 BTAD domain-containing putative transcriptional regulator [Streptomyces sp. ITFR-6]